jgi:starch synthase
MYSANLSSAIYAGADIYLMPSISEPCGLSQMIAMRYGTIPVVRETGGLRDSVTPYSAEHPEGRGFTFGNINGDEMLDAVARAVAVYAEQPKAWQALMAQDMQVDFSWNVSAGAYEDIYKKITG